VSRVIDFMLKTWDGRGHIDPAQIGTFGHSAGGATALILIGGTPDLDRVAKFCQDHPDMWDCQRVKERGPQAADPFKPPVWTHDPRIRAAAIAAPAIGYVFTKGGLADVTTPIQLWRAEKDQVAPNEWNADIVKADLPKPPEDHLVSNAGHFDFLAPCVDALAKIAPDICRSEPGFDRAAFHRQLNQALVDFFKGQLAR
jgi:predicted dienelactone hydrolase